MARSLPIVAAVAAFLPPSPPPPLVSQMSLFTSCDTACPLKIVIAARPEAGLGTQFHRRELKPFFCFFSSPLLLLLLLTFRPPPNPPPLLQIENQSSRQVHKGKGKGDGEALAAGEAGGKVKGVKIHAKKQKGGGEAAEAGEATVKHTPKKTAKFAEKVAKIDSKKKTKGGVSDF